MTDHYLDPICVTDGWAEANGQACVTHLLKLLQGYDAFLDGPNFEIKMINPKWGALAQEFHRLRMFLHDIPACSGVKHPGVPCTLCRDDPKAHRHRIPAEGEA